MVEYYAYGDLLICTPDNEVNLANRVVNGVTPGCNMQEKGKSYDCEFYALCKIIMIYNTNVNCNNLFEVWQLYIEGLELFCTCHIQFNGRCETRSMTENLNST